MSGGNSEKNGGSYRILFSQEQILNRVKEIAQKIKKYHGRKKRRQ